MDIGYDPLVIQFFISKYVLIKQHVNMCLLNDLPREKVDQFHLAFRP